MEKEVLDLIKTSFEMEIENEVKFEENEIIIKLLNNETYKITTIKLV